MLRNLAVASLASAAFGGILRDEPVSGLCDANVKSYSGYFTADEKLDKNYFFWLFESRSAPSTDPLTMWLTGGPGCSSQLALLSENGPCTVSEDGLSTVNNPYSWNSNSNIMWIDQPAGVGYSYGPKNDRDESMIAEDMYHFLQAFFAKHTDLQGREFYVFGESYGGHYAPAVSARIHKGNVNKEGIFINLKGVGVGNGLTDPVIQYPYYPVMAMNNTYGIKTVSEDKYQHMMDAAPKCVALAKMCQFNHTMCEDAYTYCNLVETTPYYNTGLNPYDIRKPCGESDLCYDFTNIETFMNLESTRNTLHVSPKVDKWESCNKAVDIVLAPGDWMRDYQQVLIPMLEDGIRVLIYAGDVDFVCNWMGNKAWTQALRWTGHSSYNSEADNDWVYSKDGTQTTGGKARTAPAKSGDGSLTFLQVYEAGHMVPMDQPQAALSLLNTFIFNKPFY